jgi:hypothetical protein
MQLVAYGAQDIYLTGNPQITFFKVVYRRHTNFAMESIEQTFNGAVDFGKRVTATISRNGDLIKDMWLELEFAQNDALANAVYGLGNALVKQVEIEIGGQLIDRQYGEWLDIWSELSVPEGKRVGYDTMVGNVPNTILDQSPDGPDTDSATWTGKDCRIYTKSKLDVPLMFWFNRNPGLALPLIALQYHEVKINLDIETARNLRRGVTAGTALAFAGTRLKLWVDYIYLDTDERRRFAQVSHEYLIEQLQFTGDESLTTGSTKRVDLNFNHPCKELIWVAQAAATKRGGGNASEPCKFTRLRKEASENSNTGSAMRIKLQLNGQDRFQERRQEYFLNVQTYKHHTHMPRSNRNVCLVSNDYVTSTTCLISDERALVEDNCQFIYVYSFALNPEEHQPSGTCNFSRIDNATLQMTNVEVGGVLKVFAVNYNVLRIMSGMGGLAYSN